MARILIIEDEDAARASIRRTLEKNSHEVVTAINGQKGLEIVKENLPDVVITDIFMPDMDGIEFIRTIVKSKPGLPVIAMTGYLETHFLQAALQFGAVCGLYKPFTPDELLAAVTKTLS